MSCAEHVPAEFGLARLGALADELTSDAAAPALMVWRCQRALLVTRQDSHLPRFREASDRSAAAGWPVVLRKTGGSACPVGPGTVQLATVEPARPDMTMNAKYQALAELIRSSLLCFGVTARTGAVAAAFCPGRYDLVVQDRKIAGISQHWFRNRAGVRCVVTAASINVEEPPELLADAVNRFYREAGSSIRCRAASLANVRLCGSEAVVAKQDLVPAFMQRMASCGAAARYDPPSVSAPLH